jgi:glycosyltransferase involved in cell wall biosynthesis
VYKPEIAIIITTIERDDLLIKTVNSIIDNWQDNWKVYIIDQNKEMNEEKNLFFDTIASQFHTKKEKRIEVIKTNYDSGLSFGRNLGVKKAKEDQIPYCVISADSICFNPTMKKIDHVKRCLKNYDLIGLDLKNKEVGWEGKLDVVDGAFEIDFIEKKCKYCSSGKLVILNCDIVRNFFIAKTETLSKVKWDDNLLMHEHEDFFMRYKQAGYKVGWTKWCSGNYEGERYKRNGSLYSKLRQKNMTACSYYLHKKWNLKNWVRYKNLDRARQK